MRSPFSGGPIDHPNHVTPSIPSSSPLTTPNTDSNWQRTNGLGKYFEFSELS